MNEHGDILQYGVQTHSCGLQSIRLGRVHTSKTWQGSFCCLSEIEVRLIGLLTG
jgi:hypothetical protein